MAHEQNPMSLENLPDYLNTRHAVSTGGSPVVEMGQLIVEEKRSSWSRFVTVMLLFLVLSVGGVGGVMTYDKMSTQELTVVVDIDQGVDPQTIPTMVSDSGGKVLSVTKKDSDTYEVKVKTRKDRQTFLEWLLKDRGVKKAVLEE